MPDAHTFKRQRRRLASAVDTQVGFVGRQSERHIVDERLAAARTGRPQVLYVEAGAGAGAGAGKSTLSLSARVSVPRAADRAHGAFDRLLEAEPSRRQLRRRWVVETGPHASGFPGSQRRRPLPGSCEHAGPPRRVR